VGEGKTEKMAISERNHRRSTRQWPRGLKDDLGGAKMHRDGNLRKDRGPKRLVKASGEDRDKGIVTTGFERVGMTP